ACCGAELGEASRLEFRVRQPHIPVDRQKAPAPQTRQARPTISTPGAATPSPHGRPSEIILRDGRTGVDGFEGSPLDARYTFQSFVVGGANRLAHAAAFQVAESIGAEQTLRYNPLYIHARVGMGKTHLLHAVAWE